MADDSFDRFPCRRDRALTAHGDARESEGACVDDEPHDPRVAANGAAPSGAEPSAVSMAFRRAPDGAVRGQDPRGSSAVAGHDDEIAAIVEVGDDLTSQSRHSLVLRGSPPAAKLLIPLTRRDVRVVEGARLEIGSGRAC